MSFNTTQIDLASNKPLVHPKTSWRFLQLKNFSLTQAKNRTFWHKKHEFFPINKGLRIKIDLICLNKAL